MSHVPTNCSQRLAAEGKPFPKSSCASCGQFSPKANQCDAMLAAPAEQAPAVAGEPDRSPEEYAIEHAEYMAKSADDVLAKFQEYGLALLAVDEGGDDGEGELFEAIDTARSELQESLVDLRGAVYEFRKRSSRCTSL